MVSRKRINLALTVSAIFVAALLACAAALSMVGAWGGFGVARAEEGETDCKTDGHALVGMYDETGESWSYSCSVCEETIELEEGTPVYSVTMNVTDADSFTASAAWNEISNIEPTIVFQDDFEIHTATYFYRDATVDLNGKKLTGPSSADNLYIFRMDTNKEIGDADPILTITDSVGTGEVDGYKFFYTRPDCTMIVEGGKYVCTDGGRLSNLRGGSLIINGGEFLCSGDSYGFILYNDTDKNVPEAIGSYFEMNGGSVNVKGGQAALSTTNTESARCSAKINGGDLIAEDTGIYWPAECELTINDGYIEGATGIDIKMGRLTVNGGKIVGTGELSEDLNDNNSGSVNDGSAIRIDGQQYGGSSNQYLDSDELVVTINGGELISRNGHAVAIYDNEDVEEETVSVEIAGGSFESAEGYDSLFFKAADGTEANESEYNMSVSVSGGTYSAPFHGSMLSDDTLSASYDGTVYVGTGEEVSEAITAAATEAGDESVEITIIAGSGNLFFADFDVTVAVSEEYGYESGEISVNLTEIGDDFNPDEAIEAHEHDVSDWIWADGVEANCGTDGTRTGVCDVCGAAVTEEVNATGNHTWGEGVVTSEPTETEDGEMTYTCEVCGEAKTEAIAATGSAPDDSAPASEEKTYKKSFAWTVGLAAGAGAVVVLGLIFTAVGCDTRKRK